VQPAFHLLLNEQGVKKRYAADFDPQEAERVFEQARTAVRGLRTSPAAAKAGKTAA